MSTSKGPKKGRSQVTRGEFSRSVKVFLVHLFRRSLAKSVNFFDILFYNPRLIDIVATFLLEEEAGAPFFSR
jgi:hypothetical protein